MAEPSDLTPIEWLDRLGSKLMARRPQIDMWRDYYEGNQDLPRGPSQHREAFREFQRSARTNLCLMCAESMVHRTQINGFRATGAGTAASEAVWRLWQQAKLDARQMGIWRKAYSQSAAFVTVGVDPRRSRTPRVTIEGPENVIVETDPAEPSRRLAALRMWWDDITRRWYATLYLPGPSPERSGERFHWQTRREYRRPPQRSYLAEEDKGRGGDESSLGLLKFTSQAWELRDDPQRSLPEVPVVPFFNGDEGEPPRAEFDVGIDIQNRLNLTVLNRLTAERYAAFRQRGLLNFEPEVDPVTGVTIAPFPPGVHQLWTVPPPEPGDPEPKLFDFQQTSTADMLRAVEADMRSFAAVTVTPVYYLPGDLINISADAVAALDAGHIAKVRQRHTVFGEAIEEALQLMATVAELDLDLTESEAVWMRPENFNPASVADSMSKMRAAGVPLPMVCEEAGWSPQRIEKLRSEMAAEEMRAALMTQVAAPPQQQSNGQRPSGEQQPTAA